MSGDPLTELIEQPIVVGRRPYVIDTCVALKWYVPEQWHAEARRYMATGIDRHAPDLLPVEGGHALLKRVRSQNDPERYLPYEDALVVVDALVAAPIQYHPSLPLNGLAFALAEEIGASHYDGLFLALAIQLGCQVVTADKKFYDKIKASPHTALARWVDERP
jgi:predicted nucleic acid-binding protein